MRKIDVEHWVIELTDRILKKQPVEDFRVELKKEFVDDPNKMARRIAGHANAAGGDPILWVIGIDEKNSKATGVNSSDFLDWFRKIKAEFIEIWPEPKEINVPYNGVTLVGILFETDRAPYLIKNQSFGKAGGGPISHEVPWRSATEVITAKREHLLRILVPVVKVPTLEFTSANIHFEKTNKKNMFKIWLEAKIYVTPHNLDKLIFPNNKVSAIIGLGAKHRFSYPSGEGEFNPEFRIVGSYPKRKVEYISQTVSKSSSEVILTGSGMVIYNAVYEFYIDKSNFPTKLNLDIKFSFNEHRATVNLSSELNKISATKGKSYKYSS